MTVFASIQNIQQEEQLQLYHPETLLEQHYGLQVHSGLVADIEIVQLQYHFWTN